MRETELFSSLQILIYLIILLFFSEIKFYISCKISSCATFYQLPQAPQCSLNARFMFVALEG
ncbi:hypothetical protein M431DRAFT_320635 [Trichoderma harzianum CBS 226.95]|uniref:Uncharacterized protein n=1 Tax=Trichoderma harzianum CBS 226.95 TaxID=983964 RepID=A0A2T3ZW56_TRIHA|nr:hypothetical protein M431DRAFT_320635 [Trichoderma harzianum CBS 226.95]PTB49044.1 hypothetical protein M431DRAFT_320635 [Trichoderma harzianum CBS 226.95]